MSAKLFKNKFINNLLQRLKDKYERESENMTIKDPYLLKIAGKVENLKDWNECNNLVADFRVAVNARIREVDKLNSMYELGKVEPKEVWQRFSDLLPEQFEDRAQDLGLVDLIERIHAVRERLVAIDQKKNPVPAEGFPWTTASLRAWMSKGRIFGLKG